MKLCHVKVGNPVTSYPYKSWEKIPEGISLEDVWQLVGPQVDRHMKDMPLWKVFCAVYFEGLAHGSQGAAVLGKDKE